MFVGSSAEALRHILGQPAHGDDEVDGIAGGDAAFAADAQREAGANPGLHAEAHRDRVPVVAAGDAGDAALADALDEERRIAGGAAPRIVRDVAITTGPAVDGERPVERLVHAEEDRSRSPSEPEDLLAERTRQRSALRPVARIWSRPAWNSVWVTAFAFAAADLERPKRFWRGPAPIARRWW